MLAHFLMEYVYASRNVQNGYYTGDNAVSFLFLYITVYL